VGIPPEWPPAEGLREVLAEGVPGGWGPWPDLPRHSSNGREDLPAGRPADRDGDGTRQAPDDECLQAVHSITDVVMLREGMAKLAAYVEDKVLGKVRATTEAAAL
jgi:hypothetical protein